MAKKKKEEPIVDNDTGSLKVKEQKEVQPTGNETKGNVTKVKEKMKMKPQIIEETITKVDLNKPEKPEENEVKEDNADDGGVVAVAENADTPQEQEEVQPENETQETPTLEEVAVEGEDQEVTIEATAEAVEEALTESMEKGKPLPENVQKLMNFMEETGGDLNDYVKLNKDYSEMDNQTVLQEYYKQTKPHLNNEEVEFLMEDQFSYDEDVDESRDIKRKKLALKEQVANAKAHLDGRKSKYYEEIKSGSKLTSEQQEAINFYQKSQEQTQHDEKANSRFLKQTDNVFNNKFKGFEFNVGEKNYRFNVNDVNKTRQSQSDISNFIGKFLDKDNNINDAAGYHKSLFTAMNPDAVANHFYEQGKTDALKESIAKSKNVSMEPRKAHVENLNTSGLMVRALNDDRPDFKFKIKNKQ